MDPHKDEAILAAAHALAFGQGLATLSMEGVARLAGVSKVTVYARFGSREGLIDAVVRRQGERLTAGLTIEPSARGTVREALTVFGKDLLSFLLSDDYLRFIQALGDRSAVPLETLDVIYGQGLDAMVHSLESWLSRAHVAGAGHFDPPDRYADLLLGMLTGLDFVRVTYGQPSPHRGAGLDGHVRFVVDAFLRASAPP